METQLETIDQEGKVPEARFKDADSCRKVFEWMFDEDKPASAKRAAIQRMFDGEPPYKKDELRKAGQGFRTNINLGEAEDLLYDAKGAYIDMLQSVEVLFSCPTKFGDTPAERKRYSKGVSLAISNMIKRWTEFQHQYLLNATNFIVHGVSFAVFQDAIDWRFAVKDLNDFYVPRDSDACEDSWEVAYARDEWSVSRLYRAIKDEEAAKSMGWDVEAVKETLKTVARGGKKNGRYESWEDLSTKLKTDDLHVCSQSGNIEMLFCFVKEFDGSITRYILPRHAGKKANDFLCTQKNKFKSMSEVVTMFAYSVGSKGKLYEIRGMGFRIQQPIQVSNRMVCQGIDGAMLSSSTMIRPRSMSDLGKQQLAFHGPYTLLHPGAEVVEGNQPNFSENTLIVQRQMSDIINRKGVGYTTSRALPEKGEMSQFEASARVSQAAGMAVTNLILFLEQFEKLLRQMVNRIKKKGYSKDLPGGELVAQLKKDLEEDGIPLEALYMLDTNKLRVTRPVGAGSPAARENAFRKLRELAAGFDEEGQRNLYRDATADILGSYISAEEYIPPAETQRVPDGTKVAILENYNMADGNQVPVFSEEFHVSHLEVHTAFMAQFIEQTQQGQLQLEEAVPVLSEIHQHCVEHLGYIEADPVKAADSARFRQVLQQSGEIITNGMRRLQAMAQKAAQEQAQAQAEGAGAMQPDPAQMKHEAELRRQMEKHEISMQILADKAARETQIALMKANSQAQIAEAIAVAKIKPPALRRAESPR